MPEQVFNKAITINAKPADVWAALTQPQLMKKWMSEELDLDIITNWKVGEPITIRGMMYKKPFETYGTVLSFMPEHKLQYTHLSSLSRLPDIPGNYTNMDFTLTPVNDKTTLTPVISNFPTETIYKHLAFYWNVTLEILKKFVEKELNAG